MKFYITTGTYYVIADLPANSPREAVEYIERLTDKAGWVVLPYATHDRKGEVAVVRTSHINIVNRYNPNHMKHNV